MTKPKTITLSTIGSHKHNNYQSFTSKQRNVVVEYDDNRRKFQYLNELFFLAWKPTQRMAICK